VLRKGEQFLLHLHMALMNLEQICDQWNATGTVMKMCSPLKMLYTCITIRRLQNFYHDYVFFLRNLLRFRKQIMTILCSDSHHFVFSHNIWMLTSHLYWMLESYIVRCWQPIDYDADIPFISMLAYVVFGCWHPVVFHINISSFQHFN